MQEEEASKRSDRIARAKEALLRAAAEELEKDLAETEKTSTTDTAAENNGCFVITAAMGNDNHPVVNDFRKLINVVVIIVSGLVATFGYNLIPYKAYVIVAGLTALVVATILTKFVKTDE